MSTTTRLDLVTVGGTTIQSINSSETRGGVEIIKSHGSADVAPVFIGHGQQAPEIRFTTNDLLSLLSTEGVGIFGLTLDSASNQYWKLVPEAGRTARDAESHTRCTINQGVVYIESINLPSNGMATANVVMAASYDGTNAPIVVTGSVALPATELADAGMFGGGPIQINGTLVPYIQDVTINTGITAEPKFSDSVTWPYRINLKMVQPTVTITTERIADFTTYGLVGGALNGTTGLAVYARKYVNNVASAAQRVASATTTHLKFTFPSGTYRVDSVNASGEDAAQIQIIAEIAVADSGDTPMAVATSAIPTS